MFCVSGASGLVYEVAWVRGFGVALGNTVWSASLVTAAYMAGLGVGAWLVGRRADRAHHADARAPLRLYAWCELAIAACGLVLLAALPRFEGISPALSSYVVDARGWHELSFVSHALRFALAAAALLPPTVAMGATLSLLARSVVREDVTQAGWRIGLLYGVNTAGAAAGALFFDLLGVPRFGVARAQGFAAALNALAALGGFALARGLVTAPPPPPAPEREAGVPAAFRLVVISLALAGFAGLGMEIVWFRFLYSALGQYREVFSILLATVLVGIWLGAAAASFVARRCASPGLWLGLAQLAFAGLAGLGLLWFDVSRPKAVVRSMLERGAIGTVEEFGLLAWNTAQVVLAPALCMGFGFPLGNALAQTRAHSVGQRAGALYLANTLGAVAGSLATGFVLLPRLGLRLSAVLLGVLAVCAAAAALRADSTPIRSSRARLRALGAGLLLPSGLLWLLASSDSDLLLRSFRAKDVVGHLLAPPSLVASSEGVLESIVVLDVPNEGRTLYTNGHSMSGTSLGAQRYMRAFSHLPLLQLDGPSDALVICFGVGTTAHAASLHDSLRSLEIVDLSRHVLEQAELFADSNRGVLADPRVSVFVNDGRQHLRMRPQASYDLVTLEPPPIGFAGVASLYSREFYALARSRLRPGGFVTQWLPVRELPAPLVKSMVRAFLDVFPATVLLNGAGGDFILMGRNAATVELDPIALAARLEARPAVRADLERVEFGSLVEIAGAFAADAAHLDEVTRDFPAITDDAPLMEYAGVYFRAEGTPSDLFDASRGARWCPRCFDAASPIAADLPIYLRLMDSVYAWAAAPDAASVLRARPPAWQGKIASADGRRVLGASRYLQRLIQER